MLFLDEVYLIDRERPLFRRLRATCLQALEALVQTISRHCPSGVTAPDLVRRFALPQIDFISLDTEGGELEILETIALR